MQKVFSIYLSFLQVGQSETLLRHVFASFRAFLNNYSIILFQGTDSHIHCIITYKYFLDSNFEPLILKEMQFYVDVYVTNYYVVVTAN